MSEIAFREPDDKGSRTPNHVLSRATTLAERLERPPRQRAVRGVLEVAGLRVEERDLMAAALRRAKALRDRTLVNLVEAMLLTNADLGAEADGIGQALCQIDALWAPPGGEGARP